MIDAFSGLGVRAFRVLKGFAAQLGDWEVRVKGLGLGERCLLQKKDWVADRFDTLAVPLGR